MAARQIKREWPRLKVEHTFYSLSVDLFLVAHSVSLHDWCDDLIMELRS